MSRSDIFLDLYKNMEELLSAKYFGRQSRYSNAVLQFINEDEGKYWREELNLCREIRNLLSHHALIEGEAVIEPSEAVIRTLREVVEEIENPPCAKTIATPTESLMRCAPGDSAKAVIEKMSERGYSHVPVMRSKALYGVFSVGTVFSYLRNHGELSLKDDVKLFELDEFLPPDKHTTEKYEFADINASYYDLKNLFSASGPAHRRVAAVFVTKTGKPDDALYGMITPWDMIRCLPKY